MLELKGYKCTKYGPYGVMLFFDRRDDRGVNLDFITGPLGPLSLDIWDQDFPKGNARLSGISVLSMGPVAIVILLLEATEEITLTSFSGGSGALEL